MRATLSLIHREFSAYFLSPIAYVVLAVFLGVTGHLFYLTLVQLSAAGPKGVEFPMQLMLGDEKFWLVYLFIPPLLTMRLFAEERSNGTLEMLMTAPLHDWQVVLSKYVACFAFYVVLWLPTLVYLPLLLGAADAAGGDRPDACVHVVFGPGARGGHVSGARSLRKQPRSQPNGVGASGALLQPGVHCRWDLAAGDGYGQSALPGPFLFQRSFALLPRLQPGFDRHPPHCSLCERCVVLPLLDGAQPGEPAMALAETPKTGLRPSGHFAIRLAGLTGIFVAAVGLVVTASASKEIGWALTGGGAIVALIGIVAEIKQGVGRIAGRRSAFGTNVALQVALAIVLLVGVNLFSFGNYRRFDWTRDRYFTLSDTVRDQMGRLRGETTIVLYQRHKTFGQLSDKPDMYDYAAERKVVEKVRDLVDQFRELGRQFRVVVLDVEEEGYNEKLAELTEQSKPLREAIDSASENSIFFYSDGKVQHLGFHDVYELDKQASQEADGGRGNLVLLYQGVDPFARKILNIDEKRPRIGVAVIHEVLSTEGSEELGMVGMRKALAARGFDTRDLILKKWSEFTGPEPAVFTYDESKYERLEEELAEVDAAVKSLEQELQEFGNLVNYWKTATLEDLTKKYADQLQGQKVSEALRTRQVAYLQQNVALREFLLSQQREERDAVAKEKVGLNVEDLIGAATNRRSAREG